MVERRSHVNRAAVMGDTHVGGLRRRDAERRLVGDHGQRGERIPLGLVQPPVDRGWMLEPGNEERILGSRGSPRESPHQGDGGDQSGSLHANTIVAARRTLGKWRIA